MKRLIVILFLVAAIGCSKKTGMSKFAGAWSGTYSSTIKNLPDSDAGTLHITVDADNKATSTLQSLHGWAPSIMKGTVDPSSGTISLFDYGEGNYGITVFLVGLNGNLSVDSGSGTLAYPWATTSGWQATKN